MLCRTFEDGIAYVGTDYLAHGLWDKYIKFETEQGTLENVASLYRRIMDAPLKELDRFHSRYGTSQVGQYLSLIAGSILK